MGKITNLSIGNIIKNNNNFTIPGYGTQEIDIQTISDEALEKIFSANYLKNPHIPDKKDIIEIQYQTKYFKEIKQEVIQRIQRNRFAIISGPTGTGKTTLARTIAYEGNISFYENIGDQDKTIKTFLEEIKTIVKGSTPQIKSIPGDLLKAITNGGVYCINEANLLSQDVIIGLANLIENGFIVFLGKKYKIHPNFFLIFTSNEGYLHAKDYNSAVIRKASGKVIFEYEKEVGEETKIVKSIYEKQRKDLKTTNYISDDDLKKIALSIFNIRNSLDNATREIQARFYSEDISDYSHFFYIRLYEKIIGEILISNDPKNLVEIIKGILPILQQKVGGGLVGSQYIENLENDTEIFERILNENAGFFIGSKTKNQEQSLSIVFGNDLFAKIVNYHFENIENSSNSNNGNNNGTHIKTTGLNRSFLKQTLANQVKSEGEELKRKDNIEEIAEAFYSAVIESQRKKDIKIDGYIDGKLEIIVGGVNYFLVSQNEEIKTQFRNLGNSKNIDEFKKLVFGNPEIEIEITDDNGETQTIPNILSNPKTFDIRRRSKIINYEKGGKKFVTLLGFSGNIKDIRYVGNESGKYYIPQSQASDVIYSFYEVISEVPEKGHFLILNDSGELETKTKQNYTTGTILKRIKSNQNEYKEIEKDLRERFFNLDKLELQNGGKELSQTGTPFPIIGARFDIQSKSLDSIGRHLEIVTPSTANILSGINNAFILGGDVLLTGESGTGKTSIAKYFANSHDLPYLSLQISEDFSENDIRGGYQWNEGVIEQQIGDFLNYYTNGGVVELKEINMAFLSVFLNQYMDKNGTINFKGKVYRRNPNFIIIATRNPFDSITYTGTKPMNLALLARFKNIEVQELSLEESSQVIKVNLERYNQNFIGNIGGNDILDNLIETIFNVSLHIRNQILKLRKTQESGTEKQLLSYLKVKLTIDKVVFIFTSSQNIDDFRSNFVSMFNLEEKEKNALFEFDEELASLINAISN